MKLCDPARRASRAFDIYPLLARLGAIPVLMGATLVPAAARADQANSAADAKALASFSERFKARYPATRVDAIRLSPVPGLYEVVMGKNVAYVESGARYALFGHVWDMQAQRDLTADAHAALDKVDVQTLPRELALKQVKGKGTRTLYVFADPQCGYCKQLERTLAELDDVTVYTFMVPILGAESRRLAGAIACATDPAATWSSWMVGGQAPGAAPTTAGTGCASSLVAIEKLAQSVGVNATPTLVSGDGRRNAGAMPAQQLVRWLAEAGRPDQATAVTVKNALR